MENHSVSQVIDHMLNGDRFSTWMGIEVLESDAGSCSISMQVRQEMLNGFGIVHGGITFALADSALAIASNSYNRLSVALEASISFPVPVRPSDKLQANAIELSRTNKIGVYQILVKNQNNKTVAIFKGTVYRTSKPVLDHE